MYRSEYSRESSYEDSSKRPPPTLYASKIDLSDAITCALDLLKGTTLPKDDQGYSSMDTLAAEIKKVHPHLTYITRNHIVELYFKDRTRKILFSGVDGIKLKDIRYVQPPEILYFGTLSSLAGKMQRFGIRSSTKGYIRFFETPELAAEFAKKFFVSPEDPIVVLKIFALEAFTNGLKISTFRPNEYIAARVDSKYIGDVI